ncbi:phospholipase C, phosphocholine-specific [Sphingomonas sp. TREG-RG-20F-R18-01]|uniref:phosphocholine-specific phospholipase C n=1 Tax=Sphingomonas sp. TREG-RG-20F-R18-01 TaxID=2914982 RepID=UPI001F55D0F5|nr:phospholipase C, phosphocholine-specific [Sphingomonas sp. TREG-RG-20F-R18-01]
MSSPDYDRRAVLRAMLASGGAAAAFMPAIARALEIPADRRSGTIMDVDHVVILTQENRAFDHYFGALNGVRGFGDRFAIPVPDHGDRSDGTVFVQPNERDGVPGLIAPFHFDTHEDFALVRHDGTPHTFPDSQAAWDNGRMGAWTKAKHNHAMGYFTRADLPFQYALAEAFTLCDAYHAATHMGTNPNRLFLWTGTNDPAGKGHGPVIDNSYDSFADPHGHGGYTWTTYPERLLAAGVGFQIYQDMADNFTDNPLAGFRRYRAARAATSGPEADLFRRTLTTRDLDLLKADVVAGTLPSVSWIIAPAAYSEHPTPSSPLQGADYTARVLDALTSNPKVWARTVFILNFDENDGLFDHVPPPAPPARDPGDPTRMIGGTTIPVDDDYHIHAQGTADAPYLHRAYGLGMRVPLYAISPWSRGGYVASDVFDHTSVIRFLETRFGVHEPNISAWRRAVCGDLTSCFDFETPNAQPFFPTLPATAALAKRASGLPLARPDPPATLIAPRQEKGVRRRRATQYRLAAILERNDTGLALRLDNPGTAQAAVFHVYDALALEAVPRRYTVGAGRSLICDVVPDATGRHDLFVLAPNGFHRRFAAHAVCFSPMLDRAGRLQLRNLAARSTEPTITDLAYGAAPRHCTLAPGGTATLALDLAHSHGWYDLRIRADGQVVRLAGHVENGRASYSDPAALGPAPVAFETAESLLKR